MTNDEAIKIIEDACWWYHKKGCSGLTQVEIFEARDMAMQALNSLEEVYANGYNDGFTQAEVNYENDKALSQEPICDRDCEHCTWTECPIEPCDEKRNCSTCKYEEYSSKCQPCRDCGTLLESYTNWEQKTQQEPCDDAISR